MKRFISAVLMLVMILGLGACGEKTLDGNKNLVLQAPNDVLVSLMTGFEEGTTVAPTRTYTEGEYTYYCYTGLEGAYRCLSSGMGYCSLTKNIAVRFQDKQKEILVDVTPAKMAGNGWEASNAQEFTDELRNGAFSDDIAQWPEYADVFTTPWFTQSHTQHQITTQLQMEDYLKSLDDPDDDLYIFSAGTSGMFRHDTPMVVLTDTDLSHAKTLKEMATALDNGKPTLLYRAHIHGNEPASGEAALAVISLLDSRWNYYLDNLNICILPRSNPDGAQNFQRTLPGNGDPNRDLLQVKSNETQSYLQLCQMLMPEVIIDGHEYFCGTEQSNVSKGDMLVGIGYTAESTVGFRQVIMDMANNIFTAADNNALICQYYSNCVNSANANISRAYAANMGSLFVLLESRGIDMGTDLYPRRIISHVISVEAILEYASSNAEKVCDTVARERETIVEQGAVYSDENRIPLETPELPSEHLQLQITVYDQLTGTAVLTDAVPNECVLDKSIIAPTAYVLPAEYTSTKNVLKRLDLHGINYRFIPEGSTVLLQQYSETGLFGETRVAFPEGAYVVCKNQVGGRNLSQLMEPSIPDHGSNKGTFVAQGLIKLKDGKYPLYRYIHDLNSQGFIDYSEK